MRFLKSLALICGLVAPAAAGQYFNTPVTSTATGTAWASQAGQFYIAASSANVSSITANVPTQSTWTIILNGATGGVNVSSFTAKYGVSATTGVFSSSVTASAFFGDISNTTGVLPPGDVPNTIKSSFTVTGGGGVLVTYGVNASTFVGNGTGITGTATSFTASNVTTNANLTGPITSVGNATTIVGPVPTAAVNLSTVAGNGANTNITSMSGLTTISSAYTATSSMTNTSAGGILVTYGVSAASGTFTNTIIKSTETVQGNAFSVGGSTLVVSGGNVGIGLTNPAQLLHVSGASNVYGELQSGGTSLDAAWESNDGTHQVWSGLLGASGAGTSGNWAVYDGGIKMVVTPGGNVGIGTTAPLQPLHVVGNAQITGQVFTSSGSYSPTFTGFSPAPTAVCNFFQVGMQVCVYCHDLGFGTSNNATHTMTLPVTSNSGYGYTGTVPGPAQDNGVYVTTVLGGLLPSSSKVLTVYKDSAQTGWTASGQSGFCPTNYCYLSN